MAVLKPFIYWKVGGKIKKLQDFIYFYRWKFPEEVNKTFVLKMYSLTNFAYKNMRELWSGQLLDIRTGRMIGSLDYRAKRWFRKEGKVFEGKIVSRKEDFRSMKKYRFYYPLTHEALNRPYTIIRPKKAKYLAIPPYPEKGYMTWIRVKKVRIPKRPAFTITAERIRREKIPKLIKDFREDVNKIFNRG